MTEKELVEILNDILLEEQQYQTYLELQVTSKNINISKYIDKDRFRIDLAAINSLDGSIHFFEAETSLYINHPSIYRFFCDYTYLLCPEEALDEIDSTTRQQQLDWASNKGIGIITVSEDKKIRIQSQVSLHKMKPIIRSEILRLMDTRTKIPFPTVPLWERKINTGDLTA
ncbi:MAG: hypothetical protein ACTSPG_03830 [Candidatus Hodarchaeales archaeon]